MRLFSTIALTALLLAQPALAETAGVTAAVNQDATGIVGSNVKTISLGDTVVSNQRIQTGGTGLVQVLLADGTTFMVGPNSDLVIDSFVYNPSAGTAQVTASFTKGVLRFIGGQTSKTEGGVTINTPVGTMGIRGAMVDVVLNPLNKSTPQRVDLKFGNEVTLQQGNKLLGRLYAAGYSLVLGEGGQYEAVKTPPNWASEIQTALAGKPGTNGGAGQRPSDKVVKESPIAKANSGNGVEKNSPIPSRFESELPALLEAIARYDELRKYITVPTTGTGFAGGQIGVSGIGLSGSLAGIVPFDEGTGDKVFSTVLFDPNGSPIGIATTLTADLAECSNCELFRYDSVTGEVTLSYDGNTVELDVASADIRESTVTERQDLTCDCDFVRWGFWSVDASGEFQGNPVSIDIDDAAWVTGDLTTGAELDVAIGEWATTSASYSGDMVGTAFTTNGYSASGTFDMTWEFSDDSGSMEGSFDGRDFSTGLDVGGGPSTSFYSTGFTGYVDGAIEGSFVNNGNQIAGGVIGGFTLEDAGWSASGIFMGAGGPDGP